MIFLLNIFLYDNKLLFLFIDLLLLMLFEYPLNKLITFSYIGNKFDLFVIIFVVLILLFSPSAHFYLKYLFLSRILI